MLLSYALNFGDKEDILDILNYYESAKSIDDVNKLDIAEAYREIGDAPNAKRILDSIPSTSKVRSSLKYMAIKSYILEQNGDLLGALHAHRDFSTTIDSIHMNIFSHDLLFAKERHEMEKSNLVKMHSKDRMIWLSLSVSFVLLIVICFLYYLYRLGKAKANLETLAAENLRLKIGQLENENEALKEILEKQKDLAKPVEDAIKIRIEMLNGLLASQITDNDLYAKPYGYWRNQIIQDKDEFMNTTRLAFKASHPRFIEYLEQHGLTESEIYYVCMRLDFVEKKSANICS